jgi:tRNA(fMet)-specific endonuclease VapC
LEKIVLDTNILIEILKSNDEIVARLKKQNAEYAISSISAMELFFGALNKSELAMLKKFVKSFEVLHIDEGISATALELVAKYAKSHHLHIADALIAATAKNHNIKLYTRFPFY